MYVEGENKRNDNHYLCCYRRGKKNRQQARMCVLSDEKKDGIHVQMKTDGNNAAKTPSDGFQTRIVCCKKGNFKIIFTNYQTTVVTAARSNLSESAFLYVYFVYAFEKLLQIIYITVIR